MEHKLLYGMSISQVARRAEMSVPAISRIINGHGTSIVNAKRISLVMGITLDQFWDRYYGSVDPRSRVVNRSSDWAA